MTLKRQLAAAALLFLASACAQGGPERVVERRTTETPAPRGAALLRSAVIDSHNVARAAVGVPPIAWNDALAASAKAYADEMARTRRFEHAHQVQGPGREGENLWTGTRDAYAYPEMMGHWLAERKDFVNLPVPAASRTGTFGDVGHYTQIVWRGSTEVGCAMASNARDDYLVCRYSPPGNVVGERAY
ncbi:MULTISPECIES: CAP domain-containing protein [unclassified Sphingomonas]|uniref:CAP domain-containing protein n=1 Tax=unclassified Sphingomonas TaxID=196159 RepID=UPI00286EF3FC|nr:CAP domain-containing protein [Sphingomonas sp.]